MAAAARALTHDHDVGVGQEGAVLVGGLALIDGAVGGFGVVQDYGVIKHLPVGQGGPCETCALKTGLSLARISSTNLKTIYISSQLSRIKRNDQILRARRQCKGSKKRGGS